MTTKYLPTIGLEIHAELKTRTKMFCDSPNDPDEKRPNVNICPICMGHPGTLPTINKEAVKHVLKVGLSVGGELADFTEFDRKNYFYPDIPKGYQLSQYAFPLVKGGTLAGVKLTRIHLEEDTGTLIHADTETQAPTSGKSASICDPNQRKSASLINFNRAGVPLMELVTEPVIHSAEEAGTFARELQLLLRYLGVSDANMEKGEMRVEANVSVARIDADTASADSRGLLYEELSYKIRGAAFAVYNALGSGHKESVYQNAFAEQLKNIGISFEKEKNIGVTYENKKVGSYQPDFVVDNKVIVEIKTLPFTEKIQKEQTHYYLKNSSYRLALLINFGSSPISIERIVYDSVRENSHKSALISDLHRRESAPLGTKVEVKNLNSFRAVERAIFYEVERHTALLEAGEKVVQETRGWDEGAGKTFSQRMKEESHDYRYFPDPDLPKLYIFELPEFSAKKLQEDMPELPEGKRGRYQKEFNLKPEQADLLVQNPSAADFFEKTVGIVGPDTKAQNLVFNYLTSDLFGLIRTGEGGGELASLKFGPEEFAELISMAERGELSSRGTKDTLALLVRRGGSPKEIAVAENLIQKSDEGELAAVVSAIVKANPKVVADYRNGKENAMQFLVGQGMKVTKGSANPDVLRNLFKKTISS